MHRRITTDEEIVDYATEHSRWSDPCLIEQAAAQSTRRFLAMAHGIPFTEQPVKTPCLLFDGRSDTYPRVVDWSHPNADSRGKVRLSVWMWTHWNGPLQPGQQVLHGCFQKSCWAPEHLRADSHRANMNDDDRHRECCTKGHQFTPENTRWTWHDKAFGADGLPNLRRRCLECHQLLIGRTYHPRNRDECLANPPERVRMIMQKRRG